MSLRSPLSDGYEVDVQDVLAHSAPSSSPRLPPPPPSVRSPIPIDWSRSKHVTRDVPGLGLGKLDCATWPAALQASYG